MPGESRGPFALMKIRWRAISNLCPSRGLKSPRKVSLPGSRRKSVAMPATWPTGTYPRLQQGLFVTRLIAPAAAPVYPPAAEEYDIVFSSYRLVRVLRALGLSVLLVAGACASSEDTETIEFTNAKDASGGSSMSEASGTGVCTVEFCPSGGPGRPCCISAQGPCGVDLGTGCTTPPSADF